MQNYLVPFRLVLCLLLMGASLNSTARAQIPWPPLTCTTAAVPPTLRAEGFGELVGDILLMCTGGLPTLTTTNVPPVNVTVSLNVPITSRVLGAGIASEALLVVDEPGTPSNPGTQQLACASVNGCTFPGTSITPGVAGPEPYDGSPGPPPRPNVFEGVVSGNSVTFFGVPLDPPGNFPPPPNNPRRIFRITNIRANAASLSVSPGAPAVLTAQVSVSAAVNIPINNPQQIVGFVQSGLSFALRTADNQGPLGGGLNVAACTTLDRMVPIATLRFGESFATAFKPRTFAPPIDINTPPPPAAQAVPGLIWNVESNFYNPLLSGPNGQLAAAGLADFGTRLKATFRNIPPGVGVWVTTTNLNPTATKQARLVVAESSPFAAMPKTDTFNADMSQLMLAGGTATAVWEVLAASPTALESFDFGLSVGGVANPTAPVTMTVAGTLAPTPPAFALPDAGFAQPASFPLPRFADPGVTVNLLQAVPCSTTVEGLISQVAGLSGLDSGERASLTATLQAAQASLARGNAISAVGQLNAFINHIRALQRSGRLAPENGDSLISAAQTIISSIR